MDEAADDSRETQEGTGEEHLAKGEGEAPTVGPLTRGGEGRDGQAKGGKGESGESGQSETDPEGAWEAARDDFNEEAEPNRLSKNQGEEENDF